jgi:hypothetical protein
MDKDYYYVAMTQSATNPWSSSRSSIGICMARPRSKVERQRLTHSIKQHCLLLQQHLLLYALPSFVVVLIDGDYLPLFVAKASAAV